jgi:hypothetical protein
LFGKRVGRIGFTNLGPIMVSPLRVAAYIATGILSSILTLGSPTAALEVDDISVVRPTVRHRPENEAVPRRLSDAQFWQLMSQLSESDHPFPSDNLVSNERFYRDVLPRLRGDQPDSAYIGVGPEQNFSYVAAAKPVVVFIVDIRRRNRNLHLMYKALFELSTGRADFLARLFSRPLPTPAVTRDPPLETMFSRIDSTTLDARQFEGNYKLVVEHLRRTHRFALESQDVEDIRFILGQFARYGPSLTYWSGQGGTGQTADAPTYQELMVTPPGGGASDSYLASESNFAAVKNLQSRNLIVPIIGDLAGQRAMPMIASWLRERHTAVSTVYISNVEQYFRARHEWDAFCSNIHGLPVNGNSQVIRSYGGALGGGGALTQEIRLLTSAFPVCQTQRAHDVP